MLKTTISCKTSAPMFMAGSAKEIPELRATSIKGNMRFIWRAVQRAESVCALREKEGEFFGNAFGKNKTKQSDVRIRINNPSFTPCKKCVVPHRDTSIYRQIGGKGSLFSMQAIPEGTPFDVVITSFGEVDKHIKFVRLFVITCLIYGFGRRSRKGFGTVVVAKKIEGIGKDVGYFIDDLETNLNEISEFDVKYTRQPNGEITAFSEPSKPLKAPDNYPYIEKIKFLKHSTKSGKQKENMEGVRVNVGLTLHNFANKTFLGFAKKSEDETRFAASVILSTASNSENDSYLVATQLNCTKYFDPADRTAFYAELEGRLK